VVAAIEELKKHGARDITIACAHPVLSGPAWDRLGALADRAAEDGWGFRLVGTTTVLHEKAPDWYMTFPIESLMSQVITKINSRGSVTGL
jgi:phosphoribosylpyrophosphate synthetase